MLRFRVSGMTCGDCAHRVSRAVEELPAVERTLVDVGRGEVLVEGHADEAAVRDAIVHAGYRVEERLPPV
ncbi:heavy-metal-associated domain-containing protein [Azospirillum sp. ST 5-10]|uniref:heavy-metal-associated domain-containing protein n=1 Tax=unclassified Azospirillum TaxID=2630922 RepID=UPI003F4A587E